MSQEDETVEVVAKPKRRPRKRVATESVELPADSTTVVKKRVPRKTTPKIAPLVQEPAAVNAPVRKAPTPLAEQKAAIKSTRRQAIVVALLIMVGVGASAAIGFTDKGSINVEQTIAQRNEQITRGEIQGEVIPVQNTPQLADGGLIGLGLNGPDTNGGHNASSTATTTPAASSTAPVGQVPMTEAEAEAAAAQASSTAQ